jgi:uncharacterized protein (TIGR02271 family)
MEMGKKLEPGMTVRSRDGDRMGKIAAVQGDTFLVEKGIFFPKEYTAKRSQVDDITDDGVYLKFGTELVESSYDEAYGTGAYGRDTSGEEWGDYQRSTAYGGGEKHKGGDKTIPVSEEKLDVQKSGMKETGRVRIHKDVKTEEKHFTVPIRREEVSVERERVEGGKEATGEFRKEDLNIPIHEEQVQVTKKPVETERIHVRSEEHTEERPYSEEVRKEDVDISRE